MNVVIDKNGLEKQYKLLVPRESFENPCKQGTMSTCNNCVQ